MLDWTGLHLIETTPILQPWPKTEFLMNQNGWLLYFTLLRWHGNLYFRPSIALPRISFIWNLYRYVIGKPLFYRGKVEWLMWNCIGSSKWYETKKIRYPGHNSSYILISIGNLLYYFGYQDLIALVKCLYQAINLLKFFNKIRNRLIKLPDTKKWLRWNLHKSKLLFYLLFIILFCLFLYIILIKIVIS